ncbi:haloacid dehalogenase superfamily, subfamily IA, variant 3 with third motif having DD or ED/haloacid dehalogenase superfamily, subfamily IA, variant 1 with third motif having Dx(3-4)D or Dx(3-4)E [Amycolatopsis lurida]|uniref:Haloacid dehalogenase n=1 Tax=Amycolatopsis lurida NRRL 2430 TaxID=1460371 RepID=A0A2P2G277_AMYLU|nr:HAD-IA family hydrolase [Amycolatopsis lurida]KFU83078.1 haloacid dehalogenase [Amycolatopsis lurida NRRL 2430]SED33992.1 haloacid dehalogenase superfamily, subfamily IA, variant 3 with third motif having DD or ED/haloacid dehalogenase superfamily, subfamily IA, variant 1 with third motif having Dx(3-4)D or Dx(3-4)E [Amycolatopsis lurida]
MELLREKDHVFLDFDGPVCDVFARLPASEVADRLQRLIEPEVIASSDPFDVLRFAASCGPNAAHVVERQLTRFEGEAVALISPAPGIAEVLRDWRAQGFTVTVVSNNSVDAIRSFLGLHDLVEFVRGISARTTSDPALLKPQPALLDAAVTALGTSPVQCVMVGDSAADILAARAAGVTSIALAKTPAKRRALGALHPDALVTDVADLRLAP